MTAKDLKNALLQEAVQGKLVPQIASEGNARDLLEEIRKEKLSHGFANSYGICGEKGKKSKSSDLRSKSQIRVTKKELPDITEDEIPFEIPENWCWCRQSDIANISTGMTPLKSESKFYENGNIPWITSSLTNNEYIENAEYFITEYAIENTSLTLYPKNTLILAMYGQGKTRGQISEILIPATINQACAAIELFLDDEYFRKYIKLFHNWNYNNVRKEASGSAQPNLNLGKVQSTVIPLPPLAEQKRIVAAIEKFMPLIEEYGKKETQLKAINEKIGTLTKKAILQEAVQGKLVPQIASEGNARDLLEEIRKERLSHGFANSYGICGEKGKKSKTSDLRSKSQISVTKKELPEITEDEIPFEIPENWCWCRLGEICNEIKRGKSPKYADKSNFLAFAQKCNVKTGGIDLSLALYLDENSITRYSETDNLVQGDIVINSTGGGTMGRVGLYETKVPAGIKGVYPDSHVTVIRSIGNINQHYLYYVLKLNQPVLEKCGTGSTNQTELKPAVLADFVIPLPPLVEQKRIVAAIEKMLPLCEKLGE